MKKASITRVPPVRLACSGRSSTAFSTSSIPYLATLRPFETKRSGCGVNEQEAFGRSGRFETLRLARIVELADVNPRPDCSDASPVRCAVRTQFARSDGRNVTLT